MLRRFIKLVYAYCDIPRGIYEINTIKHVADTCKKMPEFNYIWGMA